jgi:hypothetical protein
MAISEKRTQVTDAILPAFDYIEDAEYRRTIAGCWARPAIKAMLDPTEDMMRAGFEFHTDKHLRKFEGDVPLSDADRAVMRTIWNAMVEEILKRTNPPINWRCPDEERL